jgi:anti-sigma-K factor RskA
MSEQTDHNSLPEDELLAAEYALGVLNASDRAAAAKRLEGEHAFASMVADWETRLAPWTNEIAPIPPPSEVWERISAALPAQRPASSGLWGNIALWRGLTLATGTLAAACIAALVFFGNGGGSAPLVASLDGGGKHAFVATVDPARGTVLVVPASLTIAAGQVPELWLIAPGDKPRSLGLLDSDKAVTLSIPSDLLAQADLQTVLAVSIEPAGGSKTGAPTGPVIATGKLTKL